MSCLFDWHIVRAVPSRQLHNSYSLHKEILWESETASEAELAVKEVEFIRKYKANDPRIGNRWSKFRGGG
jgi:hypothetical protein